jgi:hypothetical protein
MIFVALVLLPSGTFVARFFKETWTSDTIAKRPIWQMVDFN